MSNELLPLESVNALELFSSLPTLSAFLDEIEKEATDFEPDTETCTVRKQIASQARKVSSSKVILDKAGKGLTDDWWNKKKAVDGFRKTSREFLQPSPPHATNRLP